MMLNLFFIFCIICASKAQILRFNIECAYEDTEILGNERYTCVLDGLTYDFSSPFYFIQVTGNHLLDRTNADVENLRLVRSQTNRIPSNIFNVFPNIQAIEIDDCGSFIIIPPDFFFAENIRDIRVVNNNSTILSNFALTYVGPTLETLILENNNMMSLAVNTFAEGSNLRRVSIANNQIRVLTPRMTSFLTSLREFDASNNRIEDLDGRIFFNSRLIERVNFAGNNILSIGSSVLNINSQLRELRLEGNQCIDRDFEFDENDVDLNSIRQALGECFRNSPFGTQLTLTVDGSLIVYDENDQVLLRIE